MVLRFASQILLNRYFKCLILHWIEYIQRNKDFNGNHRNGPVFVRMSMLSVSQFWCVCSRVMNVSSGDAVDIFHLYFEH